jgi:hypothetical protein
LTGNGKSNENSALGAYRADVCRDVFALERGCEEKLMPKPILKGRNAEREWQAGDIVQITNESHHWFPALVVVSEPKKWGVVAYLPVVDNTPEPNGLAYIRLKNEDIELVGSAVIVTKNSE